jgi:hypothetical protein
MFTTIHQFHRAHEPRRIRMKRKVQSAYGSYGVNEEKQSELVPYNDWLSSLHRSRITGWRWRMRGWVVTVNVSGRHFVERGEIDRFTARARNGEFAKAIKMPDGKGCAR